jgi:divalent metal cation (Fe/Co/Zn/Cd) transporter
MATATKDEQATTGEQASGSPPARPPRIRVGALVSATSALALLVIMFATKWYGVAGVPDPSAVRPAVSTAENAWHGLTVTRWVLLATIVAAIGAVVLHASQRRHGNKTDTSLIVAALGALSSVLLIYRVLIVLPSANRVIYQKLGAFLGLLCALGIAWGGYEAIREQRARIRAAGVAPHRRRRPRLPSRRSGL